MAEIWGEGEVDMITKATLDAMMERIKRDMTVNVYEFVRRRVLMVQTPCKKPHLLRRGSLRARLR